MRPLRFLLFLLLLAPGLFALEIPPPPDRWVTDRAGILSADQVATLDRKLSDFEQKSGAQFIIYVFRSLEGEALEDFTIRCAEKWKVGQKKFNNGLILFVFAEDKQMRIEVGYGLEGTVTDAFSSRVIRDIIAPVFQRGDYSGGLNAGADAIINKITKGEEPVAPLQQRGGQPQQGSSEINPIFVLAILFVVFFVIVPMLSRGRSRRSGCGGCWPLFFFPGGGSGITFGGGGGFSGGGFGGGGGFSGGGGSFGGGGASGGW